MELLELTSRQRDHILAGLRALQRLHTDPDILDILEEPAMSLEEIDDLAEAINTGGLEPKFHNCVQLFHDPEKQDYVDAAQKISREGELEVDDVTVVSEGEGGAYVMGWVWVPDHGL